MDCQTCRKAIEELRRTVERMTNHVLDLPPDDPTEWMVDLKDPLPSWLVPRGGGAPVRVNYALPGDFMYMPVSRWRRAQDGRPPGRVAVLFYSRLKGILSGVYDCEDDCWWHAGNPVHGDEVSHWMPLPEPP